MTTQAQAEVYEAEHVRRYNGRSVHCYNPLEHPPEQLPVIFGFNNGGSSGWFSGLLMAEDGTGLGGHCCSSEAYMLHDLGILEGCRPDRQEEFKKHYPNGYRMEFVSHTEVREHPKLMQAIALAESKKE